MKHNKNAIIALIIALGVLIGIVTYLLTVKEEYFNRIELPQSEIKIRNNTDMSYIDTILRVGLQRLDLNPIGINVRYLKSATLMDKDKEFDVKAFVYGSKGMYVLYVTHMDRREMVKVLAHELIHIRQYETGKLSVRDGRVRWLRKFYTIDNIPPYTQRPWEMEAFSMQNKFSKELTATLFQ